MHFKGSKFMLLAVTGSMLGSALAAPTALVAPTPTYSEGELTKRENHNNDLQKRGYGTSTSDGGFDAPLQRRSLRLDRRDIDSDDDDDHDDDSDDDEPKTKTNIKRDLSFGGSIGGGNIGGNIGYGQGYANTGYGNNGGYTSGDGLLKHAWNKIIEKPRQFANRHSYEDNVAQRGPDGYSSDGWKGAFWGSTGHVLEHAQTDAYKQAMRQEQINRSQPPPNNIAKRNVESGRDDKPTDDKPTDDQEHPTKPKPNEKRSISNTAGNVDSPAAHIQENLVKRDHDEEDGDAKKAWDNYLKTKQQEVADKIHDIPNVDIKITHDS